MVHNLFILCFYVRFIVFVRFKIKRLGFIGV